MQLGSKTDAGWLVLSANQDTYCAGLTAWAMMTCPPAVLNLAMLTHMHASVALIVVYITITTERKRARCSPAGCVWRHADIYLPKALATSFAPASSQQ